MENNFLKYRDEEASFDIHHTLTVGDDPKIQRMRHEKYEIFTLLSDEARFYVEGKIYNMKKNDLMIFNSREIHKVDFDKTKPYERWVFHFSKNAVLPFQTANFNLLKAFENRPLGMYNHISAETAQRENIADYFGKIKISLMNDEPGRDLMIKCYFIQMLISINRVTTEAVRRSKNAEVENKIEEILEYINGNLTENLTLENISERFFISKYYMAHLFKNSTGFSVNKYISFKRVMLADELMSNGMSATDACAAAGFNDYSNFYKTFNKVLGRSPKNISRG